MKMTGFKIKHRTAFKEGDFQRTPLSEVKTWDIADGQTVTTGGIHYRRDKDSILKQIVNFNYDGRFRSKTKRDILELQEKGVKDINIIAEKLKKTSQQIEEFLDEIAKEGNRDSSYYERKQYISKIRMNSLYGACGNAGFHLFNLDNAMNITLSGQDLIKTMSREFNHYFKEEFYKDKRFFPVEDESNKIKDDIVVLIDTDSITGDSWIRTSHGEKTIESLFNDAIKYSKVADREYGYFSNMSVCSYDEENNDYVYAKLKHVVKHTVTKEMFKITVGDKSIIVTEDESLIVERDGVPVSVKPLEVKEFDKLITINNVRYDNTAIRNQNFNLMFR